MATPRTPDPTLARILTTVTRLGSLALAARELGLPQAIVRAAVAEVAKHASGPVVVRAVQGLVPTTQAKALATTARRWFDAVRDRVNPVSAFDPSAIERTFRLGFDATALTAFAPAVAAGLARLAPGARLEWADPRDYAGSAFGEGGIDLAIGLAPMKGEGLREQILREDALVCVFRARHPRVKAKLTARQFHALRRVAVGAPSKRRDESVAVRVPDYATAGAIVRASDALLVAPECVADALLAQATGPGRGGQGALRALPAPAELPPAVLRLTWHEDRHRNPAESWLRQWLVAALGRVE